MLNGTVRYENYQGEKGKGLKNKRVRKREVLRRIDREIRREADKRKKSVEYAKKSRVKDQSFNEYN